MTRPLRRRLGVIALSALVGGTLPEWAPPILGRLPLFAVRQVDVEGTGYTHSEQILALAQFAPDASIWDDSREWVSRIRQHPLVANVRVRKTNFHKLTLKVTEVVPVALAATPRLVPVDADGVILPIDPAEQTVDLPILTGELEVRDDRLRGEQARRVLTVLATLLETHPALYGTISEAHSTRVGDGVVLWLEASYAERIVLPVADPLRGLRRIEAALVSRRSRGGADSGGGTDAKKVRVADARFRDQVVLRLKSSKEEM